MLRAICLFLFVLSSVWAAPPAKTEVVIIGAGLSGLATAHQLKRAGVSYHILELTPRIGGRVRTVRYQFAGEPEVYADSGMEEYWESNPAVKLMEQLGLPVRSDFAASSLVLGGKLEVLGPDEDAEAYLKRIFTAGEYKTLEQFKAKVAPMLKKIRADRTVPPDLLKLKNVSFAKWVKQQVRSKRVADWIRVSVECEVGTSWDRFSALDGIAEFHIFLGQGEKSYRVIGGNEKFTDALAKAVGPDNISINKRVNRVVSRDGQVVVSYLDTATNESRNIQAKYVVSTIPLFRLFEVQFDPPFSVKKRKAIETQTWGSYFKAHVFVSNKAMSRFSKQDTSFLPILSDSELGVIYDGNPDQEDAKTKVISLLVIGDHAEAFNLMPLDIVRSTITKGFDRLFPGMAKEIKGMEFYRYHPRAIAGWPVGRSRFDELSAEVRKPENGVYLSGDFTEGTHSDGAFISAFRVAADIIEKSKKQ